MLHPKQKLKRPASILSNSYHLRIGFTIFCGLHTFLVASSAQSQTPNQESSQQVAQQAQDLLSDGRAQWQRGDTKEALQSLDTALSFNQQLRNVAFEASVLTNRGQLYIITSNTDLALADLDRALLLRTQMDDRSGEAEVLTCIGQTYITAGQDTQALPFLNRAFDLWPAINTDSDRAALLNAFGDYFNWSGDRTKALQKLQEGLTLAQADHNLRIEAAILNSIGEVWWYRAKADEALNYFNQALPIRFEVHDKDGEAITLTDIAQYYASAKPTDALKYNEQALAIFRQVGDRNYAAVDLNNLGAIYESLGHPELALADYEQALSIVRETHNMDFESMILHAIGAMYHNIAQPQKALAYYRQALAQEEHTGHKAAEASTLNNIGGADFDLGQPLRALNDYKQALRIQEQLDRRSEAGTLNNIGSVFVSLKQPTEAITYYRRALPLERSGKDYYSESFTLWHLAALNEDPVPGYLAALAVAQQSGNPGVQAMIENSLMYEFQHQKRPAFAIYFGWKAVIAYQSLRGNMIIFDDNTRSSFVRSKSATYRTLAELLVSQNQLFEAEQVLNLLQDAELHETVRSLDESSHPRNSTLPAAEANPSIDAKLNPTMAAAVSLVEANAEWSQLTALSLAHKLTSDQSARLPVLDKQIGDAKGIINDFLNTVVFNEGGNDKVSLVNSRTTQLVKALAKLEPGTIAIYGDIGPHDCYLVVISVAPNPSDPLDVKVTRQAYQLATTPDKIKNIILDFHRRVDDGDDLTTDLETLSHLLLDPIAGDIKAAGSLSKDEVPTLLWSLNGLLSYIPVAALYDNSLPVGRRYLIERARSVYVTDKSMDYLVDVRSTAPFRGVGFGISEALDGLPALNNVVPELDSVIHDPTILESATGVIDGTIHKNEDFTLKTLQSSLTPTRPPVVHIASHFVFQCEPYISGKCSKESYLLISSGVLGTGYSLTLSEIGRDLSFSGSRLVTLAACGTAEMRQDNNGLAIASLAMAVQERLAPAVLATLWNVVDDSTPYLMHDFYSRWTRGQGIQKIDALREAQLSMLHGYKGEPVRFKEPRYWAPFVIFGNYR